MKNAILALLAFITFSLAYGQKVDLDESKFEVRSRNLPSKPLKPNQRKYHVQVTLQPDQESIKEIKELENLELVGLSKVPTAESADVKVLLELGQLFTDVPKMVDKSYTDNKGNRTPRFFLNMNYHYTVKGKLTTSDGNTILTKSYGVVPTPFNNGYLWESPEFRTAADANNYYMNYQATIRRQLYLEGFLRDCKIFISLANETYAYPEITLPYTLWYIDGDKHPEAKEHKTRCEEIKLLATKISPSDTLVDGKPIREGLNSNITYFEALPQKYAGDSKAEKKIRYSAYYNLATIYQILDNPSKSDYFAQKLIENDYDTDDGKKKIEANEKLFALQKVNNQNTRHFKPN